MTELLFSKLALPYIHIAHSNCQYYADESIYLGGDRDVLLTLSIVVDVDVNSADRPSDYYEITILIANPTESNLAK